MTLTFAETHNMVAYLLKSDASEGFHQIINFLNESSIKYALTVNPNIYVSCIKQFWTTVAVKKVNDVMRLQALVDRKKVVVTEDTIREALRLDDAKGVECLPNEEIFAELARMGYEKPSTKLTFYKAFFSSQWKFLIHTILQCMSAKRTSWNEFSSSMASAVICLSSGDLSTHTTKYTSPALTQKVFANIRRVGKGCSEVETPLFEGMLVAQQVVDEGDTEVHGEEVNSGDAAEGDVSAAHEEVPTVDEEQSIPSPTPPTSPPQPSHDIPSTSQAQPTPPQSPQIAQALEITKLKRRVKKLERRNKVKVLKLKRLQKVGTTQRVESSDETVMDDVSNQERMIAEMDQDANEAKVDESADIYGKKAESQAEIYKIDLEHANKVLRRSEDESQPAEVQEVVKVVTTAKIITEVITTASEIITAASTNITAAEAQVPAVTLTAAPARVTAALSRKRKGVVIRDPEESTTSTIIPVETKSKDKGKRILVEEPKPLKKQQQIEQDEKYARELEAKLNKNIDWDEAIDHVNKKVREDNAVKRYQVVKRKLQTEAQARKNMMVYLKNVAAKRQKLDEEVEELKRHLQIVPNEEDDVYTEATPLARKVPVIDYEIIEMNNKPYYKIIRADGTHQMLNAIRLEVEEESEVSLELLRFTRQQHQEGQLE
uniref:Xylulose kinase-1 n=1 Tax=Tanacetum cinerariifolium TaxID=118510 RepID=A0A6L2MMQ1_TANCI|nr:hypothetical protein [Tanacetum cinerariifolium]